MKFGLQFHILDVKTDGKRSEHGIEFVEVPNFRIPDRGFCHFIRVLIFSALIMPPLVKILSSDKVDVIHTHGQFPATVACWARFLTGRQRTVPICHTTHNPHIIMSRSVFDTFLHFAEIRIVKKVDLVIVETTMGSRTLHQRFRVDNQKIVQIYSGIDVKGINAILPQRTRLKKSTLDILSVGVVTPRKGQLILVKAAIPLMRKFSSLRVVFVGKIDDYHYYATARDIIREAGCENAFVFKGEVSSRELYGLFAQSDIFVFSSLSETQGLSILEALCFGLPTISTDLPTIREMLDNMEIVVFTPPGDIREMTSHLEELISSIDRRECLAGRGKAMASEFSWEKTAQRTVLQYSLLLERNQ